MHKAMTFVRLDFLTVKPYLTPVNLCIFGTVALIMLTFNSSAAGALGLLMTFAAMFAIYPFAIGEKSNMDILYTTLSIQRNTVVLGRYVFALLLNLFVGLFTFAFSFVVLTVLQKGMDMREALFTIAALFFMFSLIQALQLPMYFKLNYTKAKFVAFLPFAVLPMSTMIGSSLFHGLSLPGQSVGLWAWITANALVIVPACVVLWLGLMFVSYKVSIGVYRKRDL